MTIRAEKSAPRVLYVGGAARSGSTLLGEILGAQPHVLNIGEFSLFWRDLSRGGICACGKPISKCPVWGAALTSLRASHALYPPEYAALARSRARLAGTRNIHRVLWMCCLPMKFWRRDERRLGDVTLALISAAQETTETRVLVDSSKTLPSLLFLRALRMDVRLVHLVRDPRAVVASVNRSRDTPRGNARSLPPGGGTLVGIRRWVQANVLTLLAGVAASRRTRLTYEALVATPKVSIARICELGDIEDNEEIVVGREIRLSGPSHAAVGNPARTSGAVRILELDDRWKTGLSKGAQMMVRALTFPLSKYLTR